MRPVLKPALRRLWRDGETLQLGVDPGRAVVLAGLAGPLSALVHRLDGTHERSALLALADAEGVPPADADRLLTTLEAAGALDDASIGPGALRTVAREERDRLAPDLASLSLLHPRPGAAPDVLGARLGALVEVHGGGRVGAPLAAVLAAAGVGHVRVHDPAVVRPADAAPGGLLPTDVGAHRAGATHGAVRRAAPLVVTTAPARSPDVTVLVDGMGAAADLVRAGVPHLAVSVRDTRGVVGPFVVPGTTACLRCLDLRRTDRDAAWPLVAAQLAGARAPEEPCDVALALATAAHAALEVLAYLDTGTVRATAGGTLELALPDWRLRRRSWPAHPLCGCLWSATA